MFKQGLLFLLIAAMGFMSLSALSDGSNGFYVKICGSGGAIFIPLQDEEQPDPSKPQAMACHAICANEDLDSEDDA